MPTSSRDRVRVGAVGAGWWATANHFPVLAARSDVDLVAVCGSDRAALSAVRTRFGFAETTTDYARLLDYDLDAVLITTPNEWHYQQACEALARGMHVLCEKPMTLGGAEAWRLAAAADAADRHFLVPFGWHYTRLFQCARDWLTQGCVGPIELIQAHMASPMAEFFTTRPRPGNSSDDGFVAPAASTWQRPATGGYAYGQLSHLAALVAWLTGDAAEMVSAQTVKARNGVDLADSACVMLRSGAVATLSGSARLPGAARFQVTVRAYGSAGALTVDLARGLVAYEPTQGEPRASHFPSEAGTYSCIEPPSRFVDLIRGKPVANESNAVIGARAADLVWALRTSADADGRPVPTAEETGGRLARPCQEMITPSGSNQ